MFESTERLTAELGCKRNRYINDALRSYNAYNERKMIKEALGWESRLTRAESIQVLKEFEQLEKGAVVRGQTKVEGCSPATTSAWVECNVGSLVYAVCLSLD